MKIGLSQDLAGLAVVRRAISRGNAKYFEKILYPVFTAAFGHNGPDTVIIQLAVDEWLKKLWDTFILLYI